MRRNYPNGLAFAFVGLLVWQQVKAAEFTNNALITETDTAYDGQDIVVSGATLTVDGRHSFNSLLLTNGAVPTNSPTTALQEHRLDLRVANTAIQVPTDVTK